MPAWPFVFYCLTVKIGTLGERPPPSPDGIQRINQLWLVTYINEAGLETIAQAKLVTGEYVPLIAADAERLESVMEAAHDIAKAKNLEMRLIKFTNRLEIEDIAP